MTKKKATTKKKKAPQGGFTVFVKVNGEEYSSTADTLEEAVLQLPAINPKTRATMVVSKDGKATKPFLLPIPAYKRLFYPGMTGQVQRANLAKRYTLFS